MANPLTGGFDAVVQIGTRTVYRLLATIHQNSEAVPGGPITTTRLPHLMNFRIGDVEPVAGVRGWVAVQIGVPTVELLPGSEIGPGSVGQVIVHCRLRAQFEPDPGTPPLVEFIHGQLRAGFSVSVESLADGVGLRLTPSEDDAQTTFESATLTAAQRAQVAQQVREYLRAWSKKKPFLVPLGTPEFELRAKELAAGGLQVVALPLALPGGQTPPTTTADLSQVVLGPADFAVGVGKEYVLGLVQPFLDQVKASHPTFPVDPPGPWDATYHVHVTKADAKWTPAGSSATLTLYFEGDATTSSILPNADWTVSLAFILSFDSSAQVFVLSASGDPSVNVNVHAGKFGDLVEGKAEDNVRDEVKKQRDAALPDIQSSVAAVLPAQKERLQTLLRQLDEQATVTFKAAEFPLDSNGVVLRGNVGLSPRKKAPPVTLETLTGGGGYSAFANWFPGGWITQYEWKWSWWEVDPLTGLPANVTWPPPSPLPGYPPLPVPTDPPDNMGSQSALFDDRFVLEVSDLPGFPETGSSGGGVAVFGAQPAGGETEVAIPKTHPIAGQLCLRIHGFQVDPATGLDVEYVDLHAWSPGLAEQIEHELIAHLGPGGCWTDGGGSDKLAVPIKAHPDPIAQGGLWWRHWWFDPGPEIGGVWRLAEVDLLASLREVSPTKKTNVLVQFLGEGPVEAPLQAIDQALHASKRASAGVVVLVVLPEGRSSRLDRAFAESVQAVGSDLPGVQVLATEDIGGSWSRVLEVSGRARARAATRLLDAYGRLTVRHDGPVDSRALAAALTEHVVESAPLQARLIALHATARRAAPDFYFEIAPGRRIALHHLRGRPVVLGFARPGSIASLAALRRLQGVHERLDPTGTTVLSVLTEADVQDVEALRREHALTFAIIPDPRGELAGAYGIDVWPTTVTIDADGEVRTGVGVDSASVVALLGRSGA